MKTAGSVLLVATIVFAGLVLVGPQATVTPISDAGDPEYGLGVTFAGLTVAGLSGAPIDVDTYAGGAPLVVFVRDALCPVSRRYGPTTARIASEFGERGVRTLYLNVSPLDTPADMAEDAERYGLEGAYAVDHDFGIASELGVITTAEAFLFDADGRLRYRGAIDDQYGILFTKDVPRELWLRDALAEVLAGDEVTVPSTTPEGCYLAAEVHDHPEQHQ